MKVLILSLALFISQMNSSNAYLMISPSSIPFGSVKMGTQSSQMFYINNFGNDDELIYGCNGFGAFQCQLNCLGVLRHGGGCSGVVYFMPRDDRYESDTANIQTNRGSYSLFLQGQGVK